MFNFIRRSLKRNFGVDKEYYRIIDNMFGFIPNNIELYKMALIHKSASQSVSGYQINNERLEYLGDAVIECITSDHLYISYPKCHEGTLTQLRSKIVSRQSLNDLARKIGLDKYIFCHSSAGGAQKHIYGDAFEAMMGAIYLDQGYDFANRLLINNLYKKHIDLDDITHSENDYKSRLIEWCQKNHHSIVFKSRRSSESRPSAPVFLTTVLIDNIEMGHGRGDSKKCAEQEAARSVSNPFDDDRCSNLLDRLDRIDMRISDSKDGKGGKSDKGNDSSAGAGEKIGADGETPSRSSRRRRRRRRKSAANAANSTNGANSVESHVAEQHTDETTATPSAEAAVSTAESVAETPRETSPEEGVQQPKRRRGRPRKSIAAEAPAANTAANESSAVNPVENTAEKPAGRRRGRPRKNVETNIKPVAEVSSATDAPVIPDADAAESADKPARKRRGRPRKTEAEGQTAAEPRAEAADAAKPSATTEAIQ